MHHAASDRGAYGLRFTGHDLSAAVISGAPADWPVVHLAVEPERDPQPEALHTDDACTIHLRDELRTLVATREPGAATLLGPPLSPDDLAHPYLGPIATVFARWHGREAFHGAGVMVDGQAIGILGAREAGKSTLVAALAGAGLPIVADDMLVIDEQGVCRGPRTIDLRRPLPAEFIGEAELRSVRGSQRQRLALPDQPPVVPFAGWVLLSPGDQLQIDAVDAPTRLTILARWRAWRERPSDPRLMFELGTLPCWRLHAPQRWDALPATIDAVVELGRAAAAKR
jgi:hypothetical protein